jgi:O-acetylhomoserine/O-acetylserine sulfhydrylase-like pyridoxal-dependent enzyme
VLKPLGHDPALDLGIEDPYDIVADIDRALELV